MELFEHKKTGNTYAMKALSKGYVVKTGMQESVMNEKTILMMTNSPFIIRLFECYNGAQSLYFLLEPALGGELYATYNRKGFHGSEKHAKFYIAGTVFAFEHLHERHIIYRDLKPENLLLNELGQIKLTDMGLAKFVMERRTRRVVLARVSQTMFFVVMKCFLFTTTSSGYPLQSQERPTTLRQNSSLLLATRTLWIGGPWASSLSS